MSSMQAQEQAGTVPAIFDLTEIAKPFTLPETILSEVVNTLAPFVADAGKIAREAESVKVTDASQTDLIEKSKDLRKRIGKVRIAADKARKGLKEQYLKPGQYIDAAGRHIASLIEPVESRLLEGEQIVERQEQARKNALVLARSQKLAPFMAPHDMATYNLAEMSEEAFGKLLAGQQALAKQQDEERAKALEASQAAEKLRAEQEAATRAENARMKAAADELAKTAKAEREKLEAAQAAERAEAAKALAAANAARAKAEAEAKALADQQAAKAKAEAAAARKAARAPDAAKLTAYADALLALPMPTFKDQNLNPVLVGISDRRNQLTNYIKQRAAEMES